MMARLYVEVPEELDENTTRQIAEYMVALLDSGTPDTDVVKFARNVFGKRVLCDCDAELILAGVIAGRRLK